MRSLQTISSLSPTDTTEFVPVRHTSSTVAPASSGKSGYPRSVIIISLIALLIIGGLLFALLKGNGNPSPKVLVTPTVASVPTPTPRPICTRYQLSILNMNVFAISDGGGFGGTLETTWTFAVSDQTQIYNKDGLDVEALARLLESGEHPKMKHELMQSTVEVTTGGNEPATMTMRGRLKASGSSSPA